MASNIPQVRITSYTKVKPQLSLSEVQRACFLTFKTDKKTKVKPESQAIILNKVSYTTLIHQTDKGAAMLQEFVDSYQDELTKSAFLGTGAWELVEDAQKMVTDFFDTSRTRSGQKVSKELIGKWFDDVLRPFITTSIAAKYPNWPEEKQSAVVTQYRAVFADLACYNMPQTKDVYRIMDNAFTKFVAELPEDSEEDDMLLWITERMEKLGNKHKEYATLAEAI